MTACNEKAAAGYLVTTIYKGFIVKGGDRKRRDGGEMGVALIHLKAAKKAKKKSVVVKAAKTN